MAAGRVLLEAQQRRARAVLELAGERVERLGRGRLDVRAVAGARLLEPPGVEVVAQVGRRPERLAVLVGDPVAGEQRRRAASSTCPGGATAGGSARRSRARRRPPPARRRAAGAAAARSRSSRPLAWHHARACRRSAPRRTRRSSPRRSRPTCSTACSATPASTRSPTARTRSRPSTPGQLELGRLLVEELHAIGLADAAQDENGFVTATLPGQRAGRPGDRPARALDTSPDESGAGVEPLVHRGYDGGMIELPRGGTRARPRADARADREARPRHRHRQRRHAARRRRQGRHGRGDGGGRLPRRASGAAALDRSRSASRPTRRSARARSCSTSTASAPTARTRSTAPRRASSPTRRSRAASADLTIHGVEVHPGDGDRQARQRRAARGPRAGGAAAGPADAGVDLRPRGLHPRLRGRGDGRPGDDPHDRARLRRRQRSPSTSRCCGGPPRRSSPPSRARGSSSRPSEQYPNMRSYLDAPPGGVRGGAGGAAARGLRAAPGPDPRRHRRLDPQRPRAADAEHLHRRPRVPLACASGPRVQDMASAAAVAVRLAGVWAERGAGAGQRLS